MKYVTKINCWLRLKDRSVVKQAGVEIDASNLPAGAADRLMAQGVIEPVREPRQPKATKEMGEAPVRKPSRRRKTED